MKSIGLSHHFSYGKLIRFTLPSIGTMIVTSIYGVVDGLFISNVEGSDAFAAVNLIIPFTMLFGAVGFMLGTGGSALVAKTLGEDDKPRANRIFSLLIWVLGISGIVLAAVGIAFLRPIALALGATPALLDSCLVYGRILLLATPLFMLQTTFQTFFVVAERPQLSLALTIVSGVTNMVGDFVLVYLLRWGVAGAAIATALSQAVGGLAPLVYFARPNGSALRLGRPVWDGKAILRSCTNGSSEMMSNLSVSVVNMLYNMQLMRLAGANGVSAFGVLMYVSMIFSGVFMGYAIGSAPVVSFHYGAGHRDELKSLLRKSLVLTGGASLCMTGLAMVLARPLGQLFVGYAPALLAMTCHALRLFALSFLFSGVNTLASAFFTALNNGVVSALISFLRMFVFQVATILLLPALWGLEGVWLAVAAAELLAMGVSIAFLVTQNKRYRYW